MKFNEKDVIDLRKEIIIENENFLEKPPENLLFTSKNLFTKGFMGDLKELLGENNDKSF